MKLHSPDFERRFLRRWRIVRKRKPRISREFWTRHRSLPNSLGMMFLAAVGGLTVATLRARGWNRPVVEAFGALALTGVLILISPMVRRNVVLPPDLAALVWLPIAEETMFNWSWRYVRKLCITTFVLVAALFAVVLLPYSPGWISCGGLLAVSAAAIGPLMAFLLLPVRWPIREISLAMMFVFFSVYCSVPGVEPLLRGFFNEYGPAVSWLHPGGWVLVLWQAWREPAVQPGGWSIVLPLIALAASVRFSRRRHRINFQTIRILAAERWGRSRGERLMASDRELATETASREETRAEFLNEWRAHAAPPAEDAVARFVERRLTPRERLLVATLKGAFPRYLRMFWRLCRLFGLLFVAAFAYKQFRLPGDAILFFGLIAMGAAILNMTMISTLRVVPSVAAGLPFGYHEVARLRSRLLLPALMIALPPCAAFGGGAAYLAGEPWRDGVFAAVKLIVLLYALLPLGVTLSFSADTDDTTRWRWHSMITLPGIFAAAIAAVSGLVAVFIHDGLAALILLAIAGVGTRAFSAWHRLVWARGWIDLAVRK